MSNRTFPLVWSHYVDEPRLVETFRLYLSDGRVVAFDGHAWWEVCRLCEPVVRSLEDAVRVSGIDEAEDLRPGPGDGDDRATPDHAQLTFGWRDGSHVRTVTNYLYPARRLDTHARLESALDALEQAAATRSDAEDAPDVEVDWADPDGVTDAVVNVKAS